MSGYYYLVAQLPLLFFGENPGIDRRWFLAEAAKSVSAAGFALLEKACFDDFTVKNNDPGILRDYKEFEYSLRRELYNFRMSRKTELIYRPAGPLSGIDLEADPLQAEKKMLRLRWQFLEEKEAGHHFDFDFIIIYFLKLQITERMLCFVKDKGTKVFHDLCRAYRGETPRPAE